jgi:hypothetical protein
MYPSVLPAFELLKEQYDTDHDPEMVKKRIGGEVTQSWLGNNTCAMRVSKAFNYAGSVGRPANDFSVPHFPGPYRIAQAGIYKIHKGKGMAVVKGADDMWYGFRVKEFAKYLHTMYGKAKVIKEKGSKINDNDFRDKQGIIAFDVRGWNDATGHISLWDGKKVLYETSENEYFGMSRDLKDTDHLVLTQVELWVC